MTSQSTPTPPPVSRSKIVDLYFLEHRAKVLDIAAFLDRIERATDDRGEEDFRVRALRKAMRIALDDKPNRARRVLEHWSDQTTDPIEKAPGKGATGAVPPTNGGTA